MLSNYRRILLFDVETTGLNYQTDKVIEFGYVLLENGVSVEENTILINWNAVDLTFEIPEIIQQITNITPELLHTEGVHPVEAADKIYSLFKNADLVVSHNQNFDYNMTKNFLKDYYEVDFFNNVDYLDTLLIVGDNKSWSKESRFTLTDACKHWNVSLENAHRAIDDIIATSKLLDKMQAEGINIKNYINKWGYYSKYSSEAELKPLAPTKIQFHIISFGKKTVR